MVRSVATMEKILAFGVPLHVTGEGQLPRAELLHRAQKAEEFAKRISQDQIDAHARRKALVRTAVRKLATEVA